MTSKVVRFIVKEFESQNASFELIDLETLTCPQYAGELINELKPIAQKLSDADGFLICTPEYHGSISGALKNFLDFFDIEHFTGRPAGVVSVASGHGMNALSSLLTSMRALHTWQLPLAVAVGHVEAQFTNEELTNPKIKKRLQILVHELIRYGPLFKNNKFPEF